MKNDVLILLNETERCLVQESVTYYLDNDFAFKSYKESEQLSIERNNVINIISSFYGGKRIVISLLGLKLIKDALMWYGEFIPNYNTKFNAYIKLGSMIEKRNEHAYLFDIEPDSYDYMEKKEIEKHQFIISRYLLAREKHGKIDYACEIIQKPNENFTQYTKRAFEILKTKKHEENWKIIKNKDINNLSFSEDYHYFCMNTDNSY